MSYGSNPYRKDNPRWAISNAAETTKVPDLAVLLLAAEFRSAEHGGTGRLGGIVARVRDASRSAAGIAVSWLIGLPHRAGRRLYAVNDMDARTFGWQVTELRGGLARSYRDLRFVALRDDDSLRRDELRDGLGEP